MFSRFCVMLFTVYPLVEMRETLIGHKICVLIFSTNLSAKFLILITI